MGEVTEITTSHVGTMADDSKIFLADREVKRPEEKVDRMSSPPQLLCGSNRAGIAHAGHGQEIYFLISQDSFGSSMMAEHQTMK